MTPDSPTQEAALLKSDHSAGSSPARGTSPEPQTPGAGTPAPSGYAAQPPEGGDGPAAGAPRAAAGPQTPGARLWGSTAPGNRVEAHALPGAAAGLAAAGPVAGGGRGAPAAGPYTPRWALGRRRCICVRCGRARWHKAKGLCNSCYDYSLRPYRPTGTAGRGVRRSRAVVAGRLQDYAELRGYGLTIAQAAERLGVSTRTADRYEAARKTGAA